MEGRYYYSLVPWLLWGEEKSYTQSAQWKLKSSRYYDEDGTSLSMGCCGSALHGDVPIRTIAH